MQNIACSTVVRLATIWVLRYIGVSTMDTYSQITDTLGIIVGHWTDLEAATGCTVFFLATGHCKRKVGVTEHNHILPRVYCVASGQS